MEPRTKLSENEEKLFREWYAKVAEFKNLDPDPDSEEQFYDYRGFWKGEKSLREKMLQGDPESHFIDKYKTPGHPTFSTESMYSTKETPGGKWEQQDGKWVFHHSPYTYKYADKTNQYLEGTGESAVYDEPKSMNENLKKYFEALNRIRSGKAQKGDIEFFLSYTPEIDETKLQKFVEGGEFPSAEEARAAVVEAGRALQSSPEYKQQILDLAQSQEAGKISSQLAQGINLVLGGLDIANSVAQIRASDKAIKTSRRPSRPVVPGRDELLSQALRSSEEGQFDAARALAPVQQQISDQYLSDIEGSKTAATGQAGAYGAYRQVAANRRNRAAMQLAPIQDEIRRGQQARYDNLLGMRQAETQNMFQNQASLYPYDLRQYQIEQQTAANLGATGRMNLRDSLYNIGGQIAGSVGSNVARLRNQALAAGLNPDDVLGADEKLRGYIGNYRPSNPQTMYEQSYIS